MSLGFDEVSLGVTAVGYIRANGQNFIAKNCQVAHSSTGIYDISLAKPLADDETLVLGTLRGSVPPTAVRMTITDLSQTIKRVRIADGVDVRINSDFNFIVIRTISK